MSGQGDSLVPDTVDELAQFGGEDSREEALMIAAACIRPELESAQWGAEQLAASCAQIRAAIVQTEELVLNGAGDFFANLAASSEELSSLKALCRNGALAMWHEWRSKLEASNAKVLAETESHLLADLAKLDDMIRTLRDAHAAASAAEPATATAGRAAESERALGQVRAEIGEQETALADAARRTASAHEAMAALRAQLEALAEGETVASLEEELSQLGARASELRSSHEQLLAADVGSAAVAADPASATRARAQETALLTACLGWRAVTLTSSLIELSFDGGVTLRAALAPGADKSLRLRGAPTLERQPRASGEDGIGAMLIDLALTEVARDASACLSLSALPALVLRLSTLCGRALDLQREVRASAAAARAPTAHGAHLRARCPSRLTALHPPRGAAFIRAGGGAQRALPHRVHARAQGRQRAASERACAQHHLLVRRAAAPLLHHAPRRLARDATRSELPAGARASGAGVARAHPGAPGPL
jgi:hypothetical protein